MINVAWKILTYHTYISVSDYLCVTSVTLKEPDPCDRRAQYKNGSKVLRGVISVDSEKSASVICRKLWGR